ncbi:hypothetical protein GALL_448140 [mine drainage metagenome]|uniref:Uncharacterized protein n=1 Tax=mine drainage metagenome TaxID=410659 RepID=A0A1J5PQW8_9ZZZZ
MQDDLFGSHGTNAADGQRLDRFLDVFINFDVRNLLFGFKQQYLLIRQLQSRFIRNHMPATESLVNTGIAVERDTNVNITGVEFFCRLGERCFDRTKDHITLNVFLT